MSHFRMRPTYLSGGGPKSHSHIEILNEITRTKMAPQAKKIESDEDDVEPVKIKTKSKKKSETDGRNSFAVATMDGRESPVLNKSKDGIPEFFGLNLKGETIGDKKDSKSDNLDIKGMKSDTKTDLDIKGMKKKKKAETIDIKIDHVKPRVIVDA